MEEILTIYHKVISEGIFNQDPFNYKSINIHFSQGLLNVYDIRGEMPTRYTLPREEDKFLALLDKVEQKYEEVADNNQYLCSKCKLIYDLPAAKKNAMGFLACPSCSGGGDIRGDKAPGSKGDVTKVVDVKTLDDAIRLVQENGYKVKKIAHRYRAVYRDVDGAEKISDAFYKSREEVESSNEGWKFISFVKALAEDEETDV